MPFTASIKSVRRALLLFLLLPPWMLFSQIHFEEIGSRAGIHTTFKSQGVSVCDYDGDGWDDILICGWDSVALFRNNHDETFTDVSASAHVQFSGRYVMAVWADWDNDGFPDLFLGQQGGVGLNRLLRNVRGVFTDVSATSGISTSVSIGTAAAGDYDLDGRVDLLLATRDGYDKLYRNTSVGDTIRFEDVSDISGMKGNISSIAMQATWIDYDQDGDVDLFAVHDGFELSRFHLNDGALPFPNIASSLGLANVGAGNSMGVSWGDIDNDGREDVYVSRINFGGLYRNVSNSTFQEIGARAHADTNGMSWGNVFGDFDNDGRLDLAIVNVSGFGGLNPLSMLYRNNGDTTFTNVAAVSGFETRADFYGLASGDFNNDGLLDLVGACYEPTGQNRLWMNRTTSSDHWIRIRLTGTSFANTMAIGSVIRVYAGGKQFVRSLEAGSSYCSQISPVLHVGLGSAGTVDSVVVLWGGALRETFPSTPGDRLVNLQQEASHMSGVSGDRKNFVPLRPTLLSAYPNPFNAETIVTYDLPMDGTHTVQVVSMLGQVVQTVFSGVRQAGSGRVRIDGAGLASGTYLVRLQGPGGSSTLPIVLLK